MKKSTAGKMRNVVAASVLAALVPGMISMAEESITEGNFYSLGEVIVTATRTENTLEKVPASTQVITSEDMKRSTSNNLRDVLSTYANIFQKSCTRGGGHDVIIRGMDTDKSLIMVNGRRVANEADASGLGNANALDRININDVEKIEIVKGPSSALYGSEAMGGVVNIITKPSTEQTILTGLEFTKEDKSHWWHLDTGRQGKFSATADARFNKIKRATMEPEDTESNSYGTAQHYNASLNYYFNDDNYLNFYGGYYSQHLKSDRGTPELKDFPVSMGPMKLNGKAMIDGEKTKTYKQQNYGMSWNGKTEKNQWQIQTYFSKFRWADDSDQKVLQTIPGSDKMSQRAYSGYVKSKYNTYDFNTDENRMWAVEGRDTMKIGDNHRVTFGAEYVRNKISGTGLGANGDNDHTITINGSTKEASEKLIKTYAAYIQDEIEFGKWFIVPAIRYDHHNFYGSHSSPKIGVTYSAGDHFRVKANYGNGFKAPSVSQLFYDLDRVMGSGYVHLTGNPNLKPEKSNSWDLGFETEFGKGYGSLTYFDNDVENLISSIYLGKEENGHSLYRYENVNTARIKGVENTIGYRFNDTLGFKVTSTWLDAKDTTKNTRLSQRARFSQIYALTYDDHKDTGWSAMLWDQFDYHYVPASYGGTQEERTYNLVNCSLTRKVNKNTRVYGMIENIFDKVDDDSDINGRFWSFGWEHKF